MKTTKVSPKRERLPPPNAWSVTDHHIPLKFVRLDLDISIVAEEDMTSSFVFNFTKATQASNAVVFARQLLFQEIAKRHYNMLLTEG